MTWRRGWRRRQSTVRTPRTLTYDAVNQLTGDGSTSYSFDLAGNRTMSGYQTGAGNQLTNDGVYTYTYDAEGNRVSKSKSASDENWTYGYSVANQMTWMEERATSGGTLLLRVEEKYDALGRRIEEARWTSATGTVTTHFTYLGDNVRADLDGSNALVMRYVRPDGVDALGARINAAGVASWYLTDRQGTVQGNTDASGALSNKNTYDRFGARTSQTNATASDRYLYTGRELQADSGLQYNRRRWYDTRTGSWTTIDPKGFDAGDDNLYRYVKNGPTNATDPTGQYLVLSDRKVAERVIERWKRGSLGNAAKIEVTDLPSSRVVVHVSNLDKAGGIPQGLDAKDQQLLAQAAWAGDARFAGADDGRSRLEYVSDDNSPQRDQDFLWNLHDAEYKRMVAAKREQERRSLGARTGGSLDVDELLEQITAKPKSEPIDEQYLKERRALQFKNTCIAGPPVEMSRLGEINFPPLSEANVNRLWGVARCGFAGVALYAVAPLAALDREPVTKGVLLVFVGMEIDDLSTGLRQSVSGKTETPLRQQLLNEFFLATGDTEDIARKKSESAVLIGDFVIPHVTSGPVEGLTKTLAQRNPQVLSAVARYNNVARDTLAVLEKQAAHGSPGYDIRLYEGAKGLAAARGLKHVHNWSELALTEGDELLVIVAHGNRYTVRMGNARYNPQQLSEMVHYYAPASTRTIEIVGCDVGRGRWWFGFGPTYAQELADGTGKVVIAYTGKVDVSSTIAGSPQVVNFWGNLLPPGEGKKVFFPHK